MERGISSTPFDDLSLEDDIERYVEEHWNDVLADIDALVRIESVEDLATARDGAPFGEGPHAALACGLNIAARMGLETCDCDGYIGYADLPGESATQLGIIGHVDVVPAGPGWDFEPYQLTCKDGYLIGRGVSDDKGPLVVALHAVKFWADRAAREGRKLPYTVRVLFGANEETSMADVAHYRAHYADPAFLFTPDAEFPVGYGESGICSGVITSDVLGPESERVIKELAGGVAVNAVPGFARALVHVDAAWMTTALTRANAMPSICAEQAEEELLQIEARGKSAHASTPELGVSAIALLVDALLLLGVCSEKEERFLRFLSSALSSVDGSAVGVSAADEHFGALSMVGGMISLENNRITQTFDFRYPTTTTAETIKAAFAERAAQVGASFAIDHDKAPFLMDPHASAVQALLASYNRITGEGAKPFVMKGGTYARLFSNAASFGPDKPWVSKPAWVGSMHGPNEGISEEAMREAFKIYALTIGKLMQIEF